MIREVAYFFGATLYNTHRILMCSDTAIKRHKRQNPHPMYPT